MQLTDFYYNLPNDLIAQQPLKQRDASKLLVLNKENQKIEDRVFLELADMLGEDDVLVINKTRVLKARLRGKVTLRVRKTEREIEVFLHKQIGDNTWDCMVYPGKRFKLGTEIIFETPPNLPLSGEEKKKSEYDRKFIPYNTGLKERAKELRRNRTKCEEKVWNEILSNKKLGGFKFTQQKPIDNFIVDFYCSELGLIVEIDGGQHYTQQGIEYDIERSDITRKYGLRIIRFSNSEVKNNLIGVKERLLKEVGKFSPGQGGVRGGCVMKGIVKEITEVGRVIKFYPVQEPFFDTLEKIGRIPLPPYIKENLKDSERYQTTYNKDLGSIAAPTAGLHFTDDLLKKLQQKGVKIEEVLLHVGLGTFSNIRESEIEKHTMHSEYIELDPVVANRLNAYKAQGRRIIAVGTTSVRVLESFSDDKGMLSHGQKETNIFIYPGYRWKFVESMITNFHLPESTLLMLVSSLVGQENIKKAYKHAIDKEYRFFSFGDAMWIR